MKYFLLLSISLFMATAITVVKADEGMYPLSEIKNINFKAAGFDIKPENLYNPNGVSLIDALVQLSGCTGSFVSKEGLIITNHHCAFGAVSLASTPEQDYLTNGFVAQSREMEIPAKGLTVRITESYQDVSTRVLAAANKATNAAERIDFINKEIRAIVKEEEEKNKSIQAQVSEMFIGKTYVLFRYKVIKDIRLVYIPKRAVGEFGGETDNWVWPRHTGDFSFVRAYVGANGEPAEYSKNNVPFQPKNFLKINPNGANEGDFVFVLGYPGRTFRHRPAAYIEYQEKFLLPFISELFTWQNDVMIRTGKNNKKDELIQASRIKSKANVLKNYNGKLKGLRNLNLVANKRAEEVELQKFIDADVTLKNKYGTLISSIEDFYKEIAQDAKRDLVVSQLYPASYRLQACLKIANFKQELSKLPKGEKTIFYNENKEKIFKEIDELYKNLVSETDVELLVRALEDALTLPDNQRIAALDNFFNKIQGKSAKDKAMAMVVKSLKTGYISTIEDVRKQFDLPVERFYKIECDLIKLSSTLKVELQTLDSIRKDREGRLNKLMGDFIEVKSKFKKSNFIPDANSTLRLTYGRIKGYSPSDATYYAPQTTLRGVVDKGLLGGDFELPEKIKEQYFKKEYGRWKYNKLNDVPVALLYNTDTTGGNSGSPVMNSKGELIGVNFDRAYEATINDFAWDDKYSRSIGVDIRYVLWIAEKVDNASMILKELNVAP